MQKRIAPYCYLLKSAEYRDEDTWGYHLLEAMEQGFDPDYTIADGGVGLKAGQCQMSIANSGRDNYLDNE